MKIIDYLLIIIISTLPLSGCIENTSEIKPVTNNQDEVDKISWNKNMTIKSTNDNLIKFATFFENDQFLATLEDDGPESNLQIWLTNNWSLMTNVGSASKIEGVAFSPVSNLFVTYGGYNLNVWSSLNWELNRTIELDSPVEMSIQFSKNGSFLATGHRDGTIIIWNTDDWSIASVLDYGTQIYDIDISTNADLIVAGGAGRYVKIWEMETWSLVKTLNEHNTWVQTTKFSPSQNLMVSGSSKVLTSGGSDIIVWNIDDWSIVETITDETNDIRGAEFSPNGNSLATTWDSGKLLFYDTKSWEETGSLPIGTLYDSYIDFSNSGKMLVMPNSDDFSSSQIWSST